MYSFFACFLGLVELTQGDIVSDGSCWSCVFLRRLLFALNQNDIRSLWWIELHSESQQVVLLFRTGSIIIETIMGRSTVALSCLDWGQKQRGGKKGPPCGICSLYLLGKEALWAFRGGGIGLLNVQCWYDLVQKRHQMEIVVCLSSCKQGEESWCLFCTLISQPYRELDVNSHIYF